MDKSILLQKQVKDNSEDLQSEFLDLKNWEEQMKRKDEELRKEASGEIAFPPIRSKTKEMVRKDTQKQNENTSNPKRIKSSDYSAWDKFDVEKACKELDKQDSCHKYGKEKMSKEELENAYKVATKHKDEGNVFVKKQEWVKAIGCYNQALKAFPYDAVFYANRALCQLKLDNFYCAESDCSAAIQLDETYIKAYHRRATARIELKQYKEAKQDADKILKLEPSNKEVKLLLLQIEKRLERSKPLIISGEDGDDGESIEKKIAGKLFSRTETKSNPQYNTGKQERKKDTKQTVDDNKEKHSEEITVLTKKGRDICIPDWLPEKDDVAVIEPAEKRTHQRSQGLGRRVPVQEVEFKLGQGTSLRNTSDFGTIERIESTANVVNNNSKEEASVSISASKTCMLDQNTVNTTELPDPPKTSIKFLMDWKRNKSVEFRFNYLKQITPANLPKIFKDSMESDIFADILGILRTEFVNRNEPIFEYLKNLSQTKRFKALILFMSSRDKEGLRELLEYLNTNENIPEEKIKHLRDEYEV